jgi:hypothetical protein
VHQLLQVDDRCFVLHAVGDVVCGEAQQVVVIRLAGQDFLDGFSEIERIFSGRISRAAATGPAIVVVSANRECRASGFHFQPNAWIPFD